MLELLELPNEVEIALKGQLFACACTHTHVCTHMQIVVFASSQHGWEYSELDSSHWETLTQLLVC